MEYNKKEQGSYNLHVIKTNAFKTITVKVNFRELAEKEAITIRNFLSEMLTLSTKKYPSKSALTKALQDLYAANVRFSDSRFGAYLNSSFSLKVLQDKYTEKGNFKKSLALLNEIIFEPNIENEAFQEKEFATIYEQYKANLSSLKEDRRLYSYIRLLEETYPNSVSSLRSIGYLEDLEKITPQSLYQYYQNMIQHNLIDIFVIGDVDVEEIAALFREIFPVMTFKPNRAEALLVTHKKEKKVTTVEESCEGTQTQLAISFALEDLSTYERNYPLSIYNSILGGGVNSFLFQEVREKHSLAYTISSAANKLDSLLLINGGITINKEKETLSLIKKILKKLEKGEFEEAQLEAAKETYMTALDNIMESPLQILESYYMMELLGVDDIETKRKKMQKVTKEEVMDVAKKVKMHTIFYLKGEQENGED